MWVIIFKNSLNEGAKNISEQIIDDLSHPI
jgi:hypothetical protein